MRLASIPVAIALLLCGCGESDEQRSSADASSTTMTSAESTDKTPTSATPTTLTTEPTTVSAVAPTIDDILRSAVPVNLAHAGGDQDAPHSTLFAFAEALKAGATMLELDVTLTADGALVVQHDADTAKTTEVSLVVADTDLAELQALDNAYWFSPECWPCQDRPIEEYLYRGVRTGVLEPPAGYGPDDFAIVTLAQLSQRFPDIALDIEIKGDGERGVAVALALATELKALGRTDSVIVVSFDSDVVAAFNEAAPDVATSPGIAELTGWILEGTPLAQHHRVVQIPPAFNGTQVLTPDALARAEADGLAVWAWMDDASTQENEAFYASLLEMGVDGLIAGRPAAATAAIAGFGN